MALNFSAFFESNVNPFMFRSPRKDSFVNSLSRP
jgi:hypothetical protein